MNFFSKLFNKDKTLTNPVDIPVYTDIHSHLIPSIDDGSQSMIESLQLIRELKRLGYKKIITTPHIMGDYYKNTSQGIRTKLAELKKSLVENDIDIEIEAASEYYVDDHFMKLVEKDDILSFGDRYVLIETNTINYSEIIRKAFFELGLNGYKPVFAHPERYVYMWNNFTRYYEFKDMGIFFQLNLVSLSNHYSPKVREIAEKLVDEKLIDFIGTDTHDMRYVESLHKVRYSPYLEKIANLPLLNNTL